MGAIPILLIAWPALAAAVLPCIRDRRARGAAVYAAAILAAALCLWKEDTILAWLRRRRGG